MGIRFPCPNGHKLNVKTELAGKRAICPTCGAKIVVPATGAVAAGASVGRATATGGEHWSAAARENAERGGTIADEPRKAATSDSASERPPTAPSTTEPFTTNSGPAGSSSSGAASQRRLVWYVRPPAGGQFGPATEDVLRDWILDGRVAADAYVWREGWPQWKLAREAIDALPAPLAATSTAPTPAASAVSTAAESVTTTPAHVSEPLAAAVQDHHNAELAPRATAVVDASLPVSRHVSRRRRAKQTHRTLAIVMFLLLILLAAILVWVVRRDASWSASAELHRSAGHAVSTAGYHATEGAT